MCVLPMQPHEPMVFLPTLNLVEWPARPLLAAYQRSPQFSPCSGSSRSNMSYIHYLIHFVGSSSRTVLICHSLLQEAELHLWLLVQYSCIAPWLTTDLVKATLPYLGYSQLCRFDVCNRSLAFELAVSVSKLICLGLSSAATSLPARARFCLEGITGKMPVITSNVIPFKPPA